MLLAVLCDVGPTQGVGHLMRCVALAEEFAARGFAVTFVADAPSVPFAAAQLASRGFPVLEPPASPEEYDALLARLAPAVVVVDSYTLPASVYATACAHATTLALVDGDPADRAAHVYLDQNIGAEQDTWDLPSGAVRLAGLDYALMRDEILALRASARPAAGDPPRALAFFGGTDAFGAGPVIADALVQTGRPFDLTLVVPGSVEVRAQRAARPDQRIDLIEPTDRIAELVSQADLVVSAAGSSSWELLCLGAACALVCVADNQVPSYQRIAATAVIRPLGHLEGLREDLSCAVEELRNLLADPALRGSLRAAAAQMIDGQGRRRVADAVLDVETGAKRL